jgi:hypothetical protein
MSMLCNCCVRELLILARTWFAFGLPSKTGCDINPYHPAIFTLMLIMYLHFNDSPPISVQECCLTHPLLVVSFSYVALQVLAFVGHHPYLSIH